MQKLFGGQLLRIRVTGSVLFNSFVNSFSDDVLHTVSELNENTKLRVVAGVVPVVPVG